MATLQRVPEDRALREFQVRAQRLVAQVREAVTTNAARGGTAAGVFADVPIGVCVRLVEVWHAARDTGYTQDELTARLSEEGRLVFEMVVGMYDTACQASLPQLLESAAKLRDALS